MPSALQSQTPDTDTITVRPATLDDAPMLALVAAATFLDGFAGLLPGEAILAHTARHHTQEACRQLLASPGVFAWLATAPGGAAVGYSVLTPPDLPENTVQPGDLELKRIYLLSRFHGSGLAGQLLKVAIAQAQLLQAQRLLLGVHAGNQRALRFYHREGFHPIGTRHFQVGPLLCDDLVLARSLVG